MELKTREPCQAQVRSPELKLLTVSLTLSKHGRQSCMFLFPFLFFFHLLPLSSTIGVAEESVFSEKIFLLMFCCHFDLISISNAGYGR